MERSSRISLAWARLLALFRLVHQGDRSGDWIRGRGGKLFDPAAFPFLQGQDDPKDPPKPAQVSDECVAKVLDRLLVLGGEKLSYRTLDVEQIGSVYETVMGFTVETMDGPALAIRAGKHDRIPVFVDLNGLLATKPNDRAKFLKDEADRGKVTDKVGKALKEADTIDELVAALTPIVDERASPGAAVAAPGTPLLQPTDERRRTGSHYTPRSLTAPIVQHALEPAFERIGPDAKPEDVLSLKVCDPAMGSGAFLVEACRALGDRLVLAWARWPQTRPTIPPDEDEPLHARRLVAQRCLYGVDRNPRAVDLAKLSLWLATLARDHEFTFLDHALKCGDSLVGLDDRQIAAMHWDASKPGLPLFRKFIADRVAELSRKRAEIQAAPDDTMRVILEAKHRDVESVAGDVRLLGDAVLSTFFAEEKPKARERRRVEIESWVSGVGEARWDGLKAAAKSLRVGKPPIVPFHWQIEFPEVFQRENPGFDGIVGNPPFAGKNTISAGNHEHYLSWLQALHTGAHGNADLVAHFFRRAFGLLRKGGTFGLIATNTIGQGDTRDTGLAAILGDGGVIARATRRLRWPGEAAVVVSVVHMIKGEAVSPTLDMRSVRRISAYLVEGDLDTSPLALEVNAGKAFVGSYVLGVGFTFDDAAAAKGESESLASMRDLIEKDQRNAERIFPFLGGDEVNNDPRHAHARYIIDFSDYPLKREAISGPWVSMSAEERRMCRSSGLVPLDYPGDVAMDWPDLVSVVRKFVFGRRGSHSTAHWWHFERRRPALYSAIRGLDHVLAMSSKATAHFAVARLSTGAVFSQNLNVFCMSSFSDFSLISARVHETWARFLGGDLGETFYYTLEDTINSFYMPPSPPNITALEAAGEAYCSFRAELMIARGEGLTKTYNRFHAASENRSDIGRLRALHHEMDIAVLRAYGWDDLAKSAAPEFIEQEADEGKTPKTRLDWPSEFKDEVLARLLALNAERAAEERAAGMVAAGEECTEETHDME